MNNAKLILSCVAFAGSLAVAIPVVAGGKSHGGDGRAIEYTAIANNIVDYIRREKVLHLGFWNPGFKISVKALKRSIEEVAVNTVDHSDPRLKVDNIEKDAVSIPGEKVTLINQQRWDSFGNDYVKKASLVCHEYAVQLGIERNNVYTQCAKLAQALWGDPDIQGEYKVIREKVNEIIAERDAALAKERSEIERLKGDMAKQEDSLLGLAERIECLKGIPIEKMNEGCTQAELDASFSISFFAMGGCEDRRDGESLCEPTAEMKVLAQSCQDKTNKNIERFCTEWKKAGKPKLPEQPNPLQEFDR
jgi:hypothetical protein